ncbi:Hypothetical protein SMAX5B_019375 [Scophthalmus maximus]|uniref:Uncharacterized protein n=1 Tax=Scophthalmus maximus TaxID=52904 RepID=A0A2U9B898_SCOMX|nr:Hypothetical protein SMAX5B_019375 [Scophthalmus maximus]
MTGDLTCNVRNNVSSHETVIKLKRCKDSFPSSLMVTVAATAGGVTVLLLVALCLGKINHHNRSRPMTVNDGNSEIEIIYTDVVVMANIRTSSLTSQSK